MKTLYRELKCNTSRCSITKKEYITLDHIHQTITLEKVRQMLPGLSKNLYSSVEAARKVIAILLLVGQEAAIESLLSDGITDEDLPVHIDSGDDQTVGISRCGTKTFSSFDILGEHGNDQFHENQWKVLAPQFGPVNPGATAFEIDSRCGLPFSFVQSLHQKDANQEENDSSGNGRQEIFECVLHRAHQRGVDGNQEENESGRIRLAVKRFRRRSEYERERSVLQEIHYDGQNRNAHLIKHIAICGEADMPYIVFPWADGETLEKFWVMHQGGRGSEESDDGSAKDGTDDNDAAAAKATETLLWSLRQMYGLSHALQDLHMLNCRHGDLKPKNILHFTGEGGRLGVLKIADLGEAKIHEVATRDRSQGTTNKTSTELYEAPEARQMGPKAKARSRTYDSWSMGCIVLQFVVWLLHDYGAIMALTKAIDVEKHSFYYTRYETDSTTQKIREVDVRNPAVDKAIHALRNDPRCHGTALDDLVDLVDVKLLKIHPEERLEAIDLRGRLQWIVERAERRESYLIKTINPRPPLDEIFGGSPSKIPDSGPPLSNSDLAADEGARDNGNKNQEGYDEA